MLPLGGQTTLGEDQHETAEAQRVREIGVGELDPEPRAAQQQAEEQVDEQRWEPGRDGDPNREDREHQDTGADQQDLIKLVGIHDGSSHGVDGP